MGRKFRDMQTPEEQYRSQSSTRESARTGSTVPASHEVWEQMNAYEQAAHLARLDGKEAEARKWESLGSRQGGDSDTTSPSWLARMARAVLG
ncbi:hypothetical protein J7E93_07960 [Streptomyces sp. ISL-36]|uniref:hypothetical protein n=1 Tax=Streptomyces sp. ISL-36 TaxID=2819182 RepID=UPI001BEBA7E8|nr:hypothetical protein [Streptomyces sp. ISL-36]MBT2440056.1 hypothetical protein [Streptomyces sp. ISL-36]